MKKLLLLALCVGFFACNDDDTEYETVLVGVPEFISKAELRSSAEVQSAKPFSNPGKIYVYDNYIFVVDKHDGIHVIDNTNSSNPQSIAYIKIPGSEDVSIKNNYLYADSAVDLVVFDISNINNIQFVERLEDVFTTYDYQFPENVTWVDYEGFDFDNSVITGWRVEERQQEVDNLQNIEVGVFDSATGGSENVGVGGSLARFQIVEDYLYAVGSYEMDIFNISNLSEPVLANSQYSGWNIETMFHSDGFLYLGSTNGMYIYSLENPSNPEYISEFTHWEGCDPVVVDGDYAYLTLRGGNECGQMESVLEVIDISDKFYPTLAATYSLENPYGLGIRESSLFVCDGTSGLKIYEKSNPLDLQLIDTFQEVQAFDVIPLNSSLIVIADGLLNQYRYVNNTITLLSSMTLN